MDLYEQLRREAKKRYRDDVKSAGARLKFAIKNINLLHAMMGQGPNQIAVRKQGIRRSAPGTPFAKMSTLECAEQVLIECGPLKVARIAAEVQSRGHRTNDDPRKVHDAIKNAFAHHKNRFVRDANLHWTVI